MPQRQRPDYLHMKWTSADVVRITNGEVSRDALRNWSERGYLDIVGVPVGLDQEKKPASWTTLHVYLASILAEGVDRGASLKDLYAAFTHRLYEWAWENARVRRRSAKPPNPSQPERPPHGPLFRAVMDALNDSLPWDFIVEPGYTAHWVIDRNEHGIEPFTLRVLTEREMNDKAPSWRRLPTPPLVICVTDLIRSVNAQIEGRAET